MIANITTILYILSVSDESINSGTLQKGTAISRIDDNDGFQIYKYSNYLTSSDDTDSDSNDNFEVIPFIEENMYLVSGKFSVKDGSINVNITTNVHIPLDKEDIPTMKPTVHLLGRTMNYAQLSEMGYTLQIQVKPYLSKEQFNTFSINLTHPSNGRFKNAITKAKKNSTIYTTGLFFFADDQLYCEILEFQFVTAKAETESSISVPWKAKTNSHAGSSSSAIKKRIDLIRQNLVTKAPPSTSPSATDTTNSSIQNRKNKRKTTTTKISEIAKSLQNQEIENNNNDQEKIDDDVEIIEINEETIDDEEDDDVQTIAKRVTRSKKRKTNKG
jgi:hypothetical protein